MSKAELAKKIERQLNGDRDTVFLRAAEWQTILDALRAPTSDAANRPYVLPASASHGEL